VSVELEKPQVKQIDGKFSEIGKNGNWSIIKGKSFQEIKAKCLACSWLCYILDSTFTIFYCVPSDLNKWCIARQWTFYSSPLENPARRQWQMQLGTGGSGIWRGLGFGGLSWDLAPLDPLGEELAPGLG